MAPVRNWLGTTSFSWGTTANWDGIPAGVPTAVDDLVFGSDAPNCTVDVPLPICRSIDFTSYGATFSIDNTIQVGTTSSITPGATAGFVRLGASMKINGAGSIVFRGLTNNPRYSITSNGKDWPNNFGATATISASTPLYFFTDNFTVGGTFTIGNSLGSAQIQGFNIFCQGNLVITGAATGTLTALTSVTRVVLGATSTWSNVPVATAGTQLFRTNISIDIQAGSSLVTIANGTTWGGAGTTSSTLRYVSGNVLHQGTFVIQHAAGASFCNVNLNGSSDPGATAYSTSGVNFDNLESRAVGAGAGPLTLSSPLRVVNLFRTAGITGQNVKNVANLSSRFNESIMYLGGSCSHAGGRLFGNSIISFIGSGTWTEPGFSFAASSASGIANPITINTLGTLTLSGQVGIGGAANTDGFNTTCTYTAGTVVTVGSIINIVPGAGPQTLQGFSDVYIEALSVGGVVNSFPFSYGQNKVFSCRLIDTKPVTIGTVGLTSMSPGSGAASSRFSGNVGFTASNFIFVAPSGFINADVNPYRFIGFADGITYYITKNLTVRGNQANLIGVFLRGGEGTINVYTDEGTGYSSIVLSPGATQDLYIALPSRIDASGGQNLKFRTGNLYNFYGSLGFSVTLATTLASLIDTGNEFIRVSPGESRYLYPSWAAGGTYQQLPSKNVTIGNYTTDISNNFILE